MHDYIVQKGDSVRSIAEKFGVSQDAIVRVNHLSGTPLTVGERFKIPVSISRYPLHENETAQSLSDSLQISVRQTRELERGELLVMFCDD
jgi:LysM repeat protein